MSPLLVQAAQGGTLRVKPRVGVLRKRVFTQSGPDAALGDSLLSGSMLNCALQT